jgi:hypothetical protein
LAALFVTVVVGFFAVALVHAELVAGQHDLDVLRARIAEAEAERAELARATDEAAAPDRIVSHAQDVLGMVRSNQPVYLEAAAPLRPVTAITPLAVAPGDGVVDLDVVAAARPQQGAEPDAVDGAPDQLPTTSSVIAAQVDEPSQTIVGDVAAESAVSAATSAPATSPVAVEPSQAATGDGSPQASAFSGVSAASVGTAAGTGPTSAPATQSQSQNVSQAQAPSQSQSAPRSSFAGSTAVSAGIINAAGTDSAAGSGG